MVDRWRAEGAEVLNALPVAVALFDAHGRVLEANDALCALLGYSHAELTRLGARDLFAHPEQASDLTRDQRSLRDAQGHEVLCDVASVARSDSVGGRVWLTTFVDVGGRHRYTGALHHETTHDESTGLLNRKGTRELLGRLLAEESEPQVALLFCDIDNFKRVNDALGHEVGDELLVAIARRLADGLPQGCIPARHSGDEFVVICEDLAAAGGLEALSSAVLELFRTTVTPHGYVIGVSASVGAATVHQGAQSPEDLLRFADAAMYHAKDHGPGRVVRADPELLASVEREVLLEGQLRAALGADELVLHYQPLVDQAGHVTGAEALLRWPHPEHGMLSPGVILPVARHAGLLADLDQWVLRTAARQAARWPAPEGRPIQIAINLGSQLLHDPDFGPTVTEIVTDAGLAWGRLILEITETDLLDLAPATQDAMTGLVERGARFAVDDFGTGYSSLARLKDLPVQVIKLDRSFVAGIEDDPINAAIAGAALSIAHARHSLCIAEGVETTGQLYRLAVLGYDTYQGFLFAGPVPEPHLRTLITQPANYTQAAAGSNEAAHRAGTNASRDGSEQIMKAGRGIGDIAGSPRRQGEVSDASGLIPKGHLCWAYEHSGQFWDRAREYALDGLRAGQRIEFVSDTPAAEVRAQLDRDPTLAAACEAGSITVSPVHEFYRAEHAGIIDPDTAVAVRVAATHTALAEGYLGFRAIVDATPMVRTRDQREAFAHFEFLIDQVMSAQPVTALCAFNLTELGSPAIAELACLHPLTSPHASRFRLYTESPNAQTEPGGHDLALAGQLDLSCADLLTQALTHAQSDKLRINDRGLTFLDHPALLALNRHAREHHKHLTLRLAPPLATRLKPLPHLTHVHIETGT